MTSESGALTTKGVAEAVRGMLQPLLPQSFRYRRSQSEFHAPFAHGTSFMTISVTSPSRGLCSLALYLAVSHHEIQKCIREILGKGPVSEDGHSIWCNTTNIGPSSVRWTRDVAGSWVFGDWADVVAAEPQVRRLISEVALPYVQQHQDPAAIRITLLERPGHAQNLAPYQQILAVDRLFGSPAQATEDLAILEARYASFAEPYRREFEGFRDRFLSG
jgi:hypothetical protein